MPIARTLSILTTLLFAACDNPVAPFIGDEGAGEIVVDFGADPLRWPLDPYIIAAARIDRDTLAVRVDHGGGCRKHAFALVAWDGWLESEPVQIQAVLAHEDNDDPCDALLRSDLSFDLTPLRAAYATTYGADGGAIIIRLSNPGAPAGPPLRTVLYEF